MPKDAPEIDSITEFFRLARVRILRRATVSESGPAVPTVLLLHGFGVEAGRNMSVGMSEGHPLYAALAVIADHLAATHYPELR